MKAAIYCRLSEEDRHKTNRNDDSNSIKNQKAMLIQYAHSHGWDIFDIYSDDDYTGSDRNRPQFQRLLRDAKAHRFDVVLCKTQSRFTRELELVEKYIHGLFPIWGIRFVSIVDNADTDNKGNKKSRQINGLVNEWYLEDLSQNIRSVLTSRRENGFHIGAFAPYGYKKDPEQKGHLIIDEEAAAIVREIFSLFADGYGKTAIARILNDRGIPNPTGYKRQKGYRYKQPPSKTSVLWKYNSVAEILINEVYIGNLVQGKYESISYKTRRNKSRPKDQWIRYDRAHDAIIDPVLWNRVQSRIGANTQPFKHTGMVHPLAGKVFCMYCGYKIRTHKNHGYHYLQCNTRSISKDACPGAFMPLAELEGIVLAQLKAFHAALLDLSRMNREVQFDSAWNARKLRIQSQMQSYQKKADDCTAALQILYIDQSKGLIGPGDYLEMRESFRKDKEKFEKLMADCHEKIQDISSRTSTKDCMAEYTELNHLTRSMADILIDRIEMGKRDKHTRQVPIVIHWNF